MTLYRILLEALHKTLYEEQLNNMHKGELGIFDNSAII